MVSINNLTENKIDESFVTNLIDITTKGEKVSKPVEVSIAFVGPGRMRKLNKTYRKKNRVTDVLAFRSSAVSFQKFKIGPLEKTDGLGEIVICPREIKKNARKFTISFEQELARIIIHGFLHLLGYDHEKSEADAETQEKKQEQYLKQANIT